MPEIRLAEWEEFLRLSPDAHLLQTAAWGELKGEFGWKACPVVRGDLGALILFRGLPLGLSFGYIPRGPVGCADEQEQRQFWTEVDAVCRSRAAVFLKVELDTWKGDPSPIQLPEAFKPSPHEIQPPRTLVVDLRGSEEDILGRMKQKTRYNIRLAQKKGVSVRASDDIACFHSLMVQTGDRDQFGVHSLEYYQAVYRLFEQSGECALLLAEYAGQPLAGLMVFWRGSRAWYFYGASSEAERNRMPAYLLQWEAMRLAREHGCVEYDLWGVPDTDEESLESQFQTRSDGLWGVYRFKRGFGGALKRTEGAWDRVYQPVLYGVYRRVVKG